MTDDLDSVDEVEAYPALTTRQKRGALIAGALALPACWLAAVLLNFTFSGIRVAAAVASEGVDSAVLPAMFALVAMVAVLLIGGVVASNRLLMRYGVSAPRAVTWRGVGVGLALAVVVFVVSATTTGGSLSYAFVSGPVGPWAPFVEQFLVAGLGAVVGGALVGSVGWWWLAHHLRGPSVPALN